MELYDKGMDHVCEMVNAVPRDAKFEEKGLGKENQETVEDICECGTDHVGDQKMVANLEEELSKLNIGSGQGTDLYSVKTDESFEESVEHLPPGDPTRYQQLSSCWLKI